MFYYYVQLNDAPCQGKQSLWYTKDRFTGFRGQAGVKHFSIKGKHKKRDPFEIFKSPCFFFLFVPLNATLRKLYHYAAVKFKKYFYQTLIIIDTSMTTSVNTAKGDIIQVEYYK